MSSSDIGDVVIPDTSGAIIPGSGLFSYIKTPGFLGPLVVLIVGALLVAAGTGSIGSISDDTEKASFVASGSIIIIFAAVAFFRFGGLYEKLQGMQAGTPLTVLFVLVVTVLIFVALFYNYAPAATLPFSAGLLIVIGVIAAVFVLYSFSGKAPLANIISRFAFALYFFMPYALFTFGIVFDILNRRIQYVPASFTGLTGVLLNFAISLIYTKGEIPTVKNVLCEIPGLAQFSSVLAPQPMMFTLSSLAYIATYVSRSNIGGVSGFVNDPQTIGFAWLLFFSIFVLHVAVLGANGCLDRTKTISGLLMPLVYGGIMGLIGFSILERSGRTPSSPAGSPGVSNEGLLGPGGTRICPDGSIPGINGKCPQVSSSAPTCSAVGGGDEFVCETFKNGKLETSVMTE